MKLTTNSQEDEHDLREQRGKVENDMANLESEFLNDLENIKTSRTAETLADHGGNMEIFIKTPQFLETIFKTSRVSAQEFATLSTTRQVIGSCKYHAFRYFWSRGFYLTGGAKFGADFLVYPGEPSRFHSQFILVCVESAARFGALTLTELITYARMATSVKKTLVLAYLCETSSQHDEMKLDLMCARKLAIKLDDRLKLILISVNWSHI